MNHADVHLLDPARVWWVPAVRAPCRNWSGAPGCRLGARFLIEQNSRRPAREDYPLFESRAECLEWIMAHRAELNLTAPGATVTPVSLADWLLGLA